MAATRHLDSYFVDFTPFAGFDGAPLVILVNFVDVFVIIPINTRALGDSLVHIEVFSFSIFENCCIMNLNLLENLIVTMIEKLGKDALCLV
jgi:hypothetical protein